MRWAVLSAEEGAVPLVVSREGMRSHKNLGVRSAALSGPSIKAPGFAGGMLPRNIGAPGTFTVKVAFHLIGVVEMTRCVCYSSQALSGIRYSA